MKKLLATSAIAIVALSGAASAQSVLERVLGQIDNATNLASVNGTFANIAENIGSATAVTSYANDGTTITEAEYDLLVGRNTTVNTYAAVADGDYYYNPQTGVVASGADISNMTALERAGFISVTAGNTLYENADGSFEVVSTAGTAAENTARQNLLADLTTSVSYTGPAEGINGSITNTLDGINGATQEAIASIDVSAIEWNMPTFDFGDMATTALGAVNTGDITLGVNSAIDEAATSTTNAISAVIDQLGGSADTGAIVLNVASNMTGVNGSITNVMEQVNGSIGNLSTTALGAVNTGTIISGVDAAVAGIVGSTSGGTNGQ
jgi:hypothetical protein